MYAQVVIAVLTGLAATIEDVVHRRIPNWIPLTAFLAGFLCLGWSRGWRGSLSSLGGAVAGFLVFLIFYWLGGMGGGDVKLMAGLGGVLGIERLLAAALWTAACGGLLAGLWLAVTALRNLRIKDPRARRRVEAIPYAPAIALGSFLALLPQV